MDRFSRSRPAFDRDDISPERDRRTAFGLFAAFPAALALASALASLAGMG